MSRSYETGWDYDEVHETWRPPVTQPVPDVRAAVSGALPVGVITAYWGTTAPTGWLVCDGSPIPTQYSALIALVGANTPNLKGRVLVARNAAETEFDTLGETGGAKTVTLTESQLASHNHTQNSHNHTQNSHGHTADDNLAGGQNTGSTEPPNHDHMVSINAVESSGADAAGSNRWRGAAFAGSTYGGAGRAVTAGVNAGIAHVHSVAAHEHNITVNAGTATNQATTAANNTAGGNTAHSNLQPYAVVTYIIKAAA